MMDHLNEVEDAAARYGVANYQIQMEVFVLSLLDKDSDVALLQIEAARTSSLDFVKSLAPPPLSIDHKAKAGRVAVAMLNHSFNRLRIVIESPDDDVPVAPVN